MGHNGNCACLGIKYTLLYISRMIQHCTHITLIICKNIYYNTDSKTVIMIRCCRTVLEYGDIINIFNVCVCGIVLFAMVHVFDLCTFYYR